MGVKGLTTFLKKISPSAFSANGLKGSVREVYFDMNGIIHSLSRRHLKSLDGNQIRHIVNLIQKEQNTSIRNTGRILSNDQIRILSLIPLFEQIYHMMFTILKKFTGANRLFVTFDGIAPVAKWNLQQKRRASYTTMDDFEDSNTFGREALTPGSMLMPLIEKTLFWVAKDFLISQMTSPSFKRTSPFVVVDSSCRAGEAEWKVIQFLKLSLQEQCSSQGFNQDSFSITKLLTEKISHLNVRRVICASDADSMLMALAFPIRSLFTVDITHSLHQNILFSPNSVIQSFVQLDSNNFLELRDGLFLLSLLCIGSDYVSRLRGMPSLDEAWGCFINWVKEQTNSSSWKLIDRNNRCVNIEALQNFLSFCKYSKTSFNFAEKNEEVCPDDAVIDNEHSATLPNLSSVESYLSIIVCNLDILYTGICRFFAIERVSSPSIDDVILWSPSSKKQIKTPIYSIPDPSLLVPGAVAMMLIPESKHACLASSLQHFRKFTFNRNESIFPFPTEDTFVTTPSLSALEENIQKIYSSSLSPFEKEFTLPCTSPSVISLHDTHAVADAHDGQNKFSKLFSTAHPSDSPICNNFEIQGHIPFGISSFGKYTDTNIPYASVPPLYQSNSPDLGNWTYLENEIGLLNSILEKYPKKA